MTISSNSCEDTGTDEKIVLKTLREVRKDKPTREAQRDKPKYDNIGSPWV